MTLKIIFSLLFVTILIGSLAWLWQRQPKPLQTPTEELTATEEAQGESRPDETMSLKVEDNKVVFSKTLKLEGETFPNEFVAIYTNDFQAIVKSDASGNFQTEVTLTTGLNLLTVATVTDDQARKTQKSLTLYSAVQNEAKIVFAGPVKNVFDTLVTVTDGGLDKNIRTSKSTNFDIPEDEEEQSADSRVENVRIGDYAVALGNLPENAKDNDTIIAQSLEIIRGNKPQNDIKVTKIKIISPVRQNIFSATNLADNKVLELTMDKNSSIKLDEKDAKSADIKRDTSAIIFYTAGDKNIIDLIYLLP